MITCIITNTQESHHINIKNLNRLWGVYGGLLKQNHGPPLNLDHMHFKLSTLRKTLLECGDFNFTIFIYYTENSDGRLYVRLIDLNGEINRERGRVQVSRDNNNWGTICDDSWDERDAE